MNQMPTYVLGQGQGTFLPVQGQGHGGFMPGNFQPVQGQSSFQPIPVQSNYPPGHGHFLPGQTHRHFLPRQGPPGTFLPGQGQGTFLAGQEPSDQSRLSSEIIADMKSHGIFDQFRRECLSDADMKPAYRNLTQRVEGNVMSFMSKITFTEKLNMIQLREQLRKHITESKVLETGVQRIVDQVVVSKIDAVFRAKVEEVVYNHLGIELPVSATTEATKDNQEQQDKSVDENLLPKDLEAVSSDSSSDHHSHNRSDEINKEPTETNNDHSKVSVKLVKETVGAHAQSDTEHCKFTTREVDCSGSDVSGFSGLDSHDESNHSSYTKRYMATSEEMEISEDTNMSGTDHANINSKQGGKEKNESSAKKKSESKTSSDKIKFSTSHKERKDKDKSKGHHHHSHHHSHHKSEKSDNKDKSVLEHKHRKHSENCESSKKDGKERDKNRDKDKTDQRPKEKVDKQKEKSDKEKPYKERESSAKDKKLAVKNRESVKEREKLDKSKPSKEKSDHTKKSTKDAKEKSVKEKSDKDKSDKDKSDKDKSDKDKSDKDKSDKDKSDKDKCDKDKFDKDKSDKDKSDKDKSDKDKSDKDKYDKDKSKEKDKYHHKSKQLDKDRHNRDKISSTKNRSTSSSSKKDTNDNKNTDKEKSSSRSRDSSHKHKHISKSEHKHTLSDKSKDRAKSSSSSMVKDKKGGEDSKSSGKSHKKKEKKVEDDHYSFKDKNYDRRSTDRDSNDDSRKNNNYRGELKSEVNKKTVVFSSGSTNSTNNSDKVEHKTTKQKVALLTDPTYNSYKVKHEISIKMEDSSISSTSDSDQVEQEKNNRKEAPSTDSLYNSERVEQNMAIKKEASSTNPTYKSDRVDQEITIKKEVTNTISTCDSDVLEQETTNKREDASNLNITETKIMTIKDTQTESSILSAPEIETQHCDFPTEVEIASPRENNLHLEESRDTILRKLHEEFGKEENILGFTITVDDIKRVIRVGALELLRNKAYDDDLVHYFQKPYESQAILRMYNENITKLKKSIEEYEASQKPAQVDTPKEIGKKRKLPETESSMNLNHKYECKRKRLIGDQNKDENNVCDVKSHNGIIKLVRDRNGRTTKPDLIPAKLQEIVDLASNIGEQQLVVMLRRDGIDVASRNGSLNLVGSRKSSRTRAFEKPDLAIKKQETAKIVASPNDGLQLDPNAKAGNNGFIKPQDVPAKQRKVIRGAAQQRYSEEDLFKPRPVLSRTTSRRRSGVPPN